MLVVVYLISNVHVQKVLPIFQDPIPIDRGLPVREAMPHKLNINQHTTKPMLVNVLVFFENIYAQTNTPRIKKK